METDFGFGSFIHSFCKFETSFVQTSDRLRHGFTKNPKLMLIWLTKLRAKVEYIYYVLCTSYFV